MQELEDSKSALSAEQSRALKLEAELAEARQRLEVPVHAQAPVRLASILGHAIALSQRDSRSLTTTALCMEILTFGTKATAVHDAVTSLMRMQNHPRDSDCDGSGGPRAGEGAREVPASAERSGCGQEQGWHLGLHKRPVEFSDSAASRVRASSRHETDLQSWQ